MTHDDLKRNWRKLALVNEMADTITPLTELYADCLGERGGGIAFLIDGMKEDDVGGRSVSVFRLDWCDNVFDLTEGDMRVGSLVSTEVGGH